MHAADAAILTVPLPLLSDIALPAAARRKMAAASDIGFGNVVKILLRFTNKWWVDEGGRKLADLSVKAIPELLRRLARRLGLK